MTLINNYICCLCESQSPSEVILTLPETPLANNFSINKQTIETYPLNIVACTECCHVQLREKVDPNIIFKNYLYKSGISKTFVKHFMDYVNTVMHYAILIIYHRKKSLSKKAFQMPVSQYPSLSLFSGQVIYQMKKPTSILITNSHFLL